MSGHRGDGGNDGETQQTCDEDLPPTDPVAEVATGKHQHREHEGVGVDDPLQLSCGRVERSAQGWDADVDDGVVHHAHELGQAEHREGDEPALRTGGERRLLGGDVYR